jgi:hypothetical protein
MGVHVEGPVLTISPSRSRWGFAAFALSAALLLVPVIPFQWVFAPPLLLGAIVGVVVGPHMARRLGTEMRIDPNSQIVSISRYSHEIEGFSVKKIPFQRVVGFQFLRKGGGAHYAQLNLIYHEDDGSLGRICLLCHAIQFYVARAAGKLAALSHWNILDDNGRQGASVVKP